jgi:Hint domain-containing protein
MTYTPGLTPEPGRRPRRLTADPAHASAKQRIVTLKDSHLNHLRAPTPAPGPAPEPIPAETPQTHRFSFAVLSDDGSAHRFEHEAPRELYLEDICACFGRGTLIATEGGQSAVEDLQPGDRIKTRDGGMQTLRWISTCTLPHPESGQAGEDIAIRIKADALGELRPMQDLVVSARFRLLTNHPSCAALFGSPETLAPAVDLLDGESILSVRPARDLEFFNLLFDEHQIIEANGLETESYHPGNFGVAVMSLEMQSHLRRIFPHLSGDLNQFGRTARPILKGFEAEALRVC